MDSENGQQEVQQATNPYIIPGAIIIGFALIAGVLFFNGGVTVGNFGTNQHSNVATDAIAPDVKTARPIDENDHIRGNPNAPIMIVEYSDYECPFCKQFHNTMNQVMDDYGASGKVAWVYRQFPIEQLHPNAPTISLAAECVANLGGNDAFWSFTDTIFDSRGTNEFTNMTKISTYAKKSGVDEIAFKTCLTEKQLTAEVDDDFTDAVNAGAQGTPYSLVLVGGQQGVINGAQPYTAVKQILDTLIEQIEGS